MKWATVYVYDSREAVDPIVAEASDFMFPWPPSWTFDREKAREALGHCDGCDRKSADDPDIGWCRQWQDRTLDALEGCVVPDPRLARIDAVLAMLGKRDGYLADVARNILGGESA